MNPVDAFWHICNFFAPSLGVGAIAAILAKLLWRRALAAVPWLRLAGGAAAAMAVVSVLGLVAFEHDGKMVTYAAMVVVCAIVLWWMGFRGRG